MLTNKIFNASALSLLVVSIEFLMSRYAILLASYSRCSCGVNFAISTNAKTLKNITQKQILYLGIRCPPYGQ